MIIELIRLSYLEAPLTYVIVENELLLNICDIYYLRYDSINIIY